MANDDVIISIHPVPNHGQVKTIRSLLDRLVYPRISQLDVFLVPAGG